MAKKPHDNSVSITTPSRFGSHKSMVIDPGDRQLKENEVLCKDDTHVYITTVDRLDNGLADPKRYSLI
jgi:hypothetical protein